MAETYWKKISHMEEAINHNDPSCLHEFIDILAQNNLLTEHMLSALCEATHDQHNRTKVWKLLHKLAKDHQ